MVAIKAPSSIDHASPLGKYSPKAAAAAAIPTVDLSSPGAATAVAEACRRVGCFRATNHGIPSSLASALESLATAFFALPHSDKAAAAIAARRPFGYGSKCIGPNGDVGWLEYLLLSLSSSSSSSIPGASSLPPSLRLALEEYTEAVREASWKVLELMAEGLGLQERGTLRSMVDGSDEELVRVNHYPPTEQQDGCVGMTGFGEHTDPQLVSLLRSNRTAGYQVLLQGPEDPRWVNVAPDPDSLFVNVGDSLQVLTNGRFRSVKHRVVAPEGGQASRLSVIYFGGPAPAQRIAPLPELMKEGEKSLYRDFTWAEYKAAAYKTRLGDNRLGPFELLHGAVKPAMEPEHCCSGSTGCGVVQPPPHVARVH